MNGGGEPARGGRPSSLRFLVSRGHYARMASADLEPEGDRVQAAWAALLWLASLAFFVGVLITDTELTLPRSTLSESASDVVSVAGAAFSGWAFFVWVRRLALG